MLRVDTIPWPLRPLWLTWGWSQGLSLAAAVQLLHRSCSIHWSGREALEAYPQRIYCLWHEDLLPFFAAFGRFDGQVWLNHPAWFMKPVHVLLGQMGVKELVLGSTGHEGKEASARLVEHLKAGASTAMAVDGPAGPYHQARKGAAHLSRNSGVPLVPLRFRVTPSVRLPTWDRKRVPLPGGRIDVELCTPIFVEDADHGHAQMVAALGA